MNILSAFIIFDILIIVYELLVTIFSSLYELSGLSKDEARFQVTSLLTGTGFTTAESEKMLATKKRKRITRYIMIVSYIFNISIISTVVSVFTSPKQEFTNELIIGLIISVSVLALVILSKKITKCRKAIDKFFLNVMKKFYNRLNNN